MRFLIHSNSGPDQEDRYTHDYIADTVEQALAQHLAKKSQFVPVAWTPSTQAKATPSKSRADAEASGRLIVGNQVVHPGTQAAPFRIGGIYRQQCGDLVRLDPTAYGVGGAHKVADGMAFATILLGGSPSRNDGHRQLVDGRYPGCKDVVGHGCHLIPGELDAQGYPLGHPCADIPAPTVQPKPATLAESTDPKDLAMLKRDGPAKRTPSPVVPAPVATAKPCPWGAFQSPDLGASSHLVNPAHGSASLQS